MEIHDFSEHCVLIDAIFEGTKLLRTKAYADTGRVISLFSYRTNFSIKLDPVLVEKFHTLEKELPICDTAMSRFLNVMEPGDFIRWTNKEKNVPRFGKLFLLTPTGGSIQIEQGVVHLKPYQGVVFCSTDKHKVDKVQQVQKAIIWIIPHYYEP